MKEAFDSLKTYHQKFINDGNVKHIEDWTLKYGCLIPLSYLNLVRIWYKLPIVKEV